MDLHDLVWSVVSGDLLAARQWVADARRAQVPWDHYEQPTGMTDRELAIAAGLVELLAEREGVPPPPWTRKIGPQQELVILDPGLEQMPRSFARARAFGPEPLRKRNLIALPDFLDVA
jgi:hypothetical protein